MNNRELLLIKKNFLENGYFIDDKSHKEIENISEIFETLYKTQFTENISVNRNLLRCFSNEPEVRDLFNKSEIFNILRILEILHPLYTGPIVTHYTSNDKTGGGYGLEMHQDWPSMATSNNGVIVWVSLYDTNVNTHGLILAPGSHKNGPLPGKQTESGYIINLKNIPKTIQPEIKKGTFLFMHPWLAHSTFVNNNCAPAQYKLSISTRFDDFFCKKWSMRGYRNAYQNIVDRSMWLID